KQAELARELLGLCDPALRGWEWDLGQRLCRDLLEGTKGGPGDPRGVSVIALDVAARAALDHIPQKSPGVLSVHLDPTLEWVALLTRHHYREGPFEPIDLMRVIEMGTGKEFVGFRWNSPQVMDIRHGRKMNLPIPELLALTPDLTRALLRPHEKPPQL